MWVSLSQPGHKLPTLQTAERACWEISSPSYRRAQTHREQNSCFQLFYTKKKKKKKKRWYSHSSTSVRAAPLPPWLINPLSIIRSRVSPRFMNSAGALPYPPLELQSARQIPIRARPRHEQKHHCDQACLQLPVSLLASAGYVARPFEHNWALCLFRRSESPMNVRHTSFLWGGGQRADHKPLIDYMFVMRRFLMNYRQKCSWSESLLVVIGRKDKKMFQLVKSSWFLQCR